MPWCRLCHPKMTAPADRRHRLREWLYNWMCDWIEIGIASGAFLRIFHLLIRQLSLCRHVANRSHSSHIRMSLIERFAAFDPDTVSSHIHVLPTRRATHSLFSHSAAHNPITYSAADDHEAIQSQRFLTKHYYRNSLHCDTHPHTRSYAEHIFIFDELRILMTEPKHLHLIASSVWKRRNVCFRRVASLDWNCYG